MYDIDSDFHNVPVKVSKLLVLLICWLYACKEINMMLKTAVTLMKILFVISSLVMMHLFLFG